MGLESIQRAVLETANAQSDHIVQAARKAADDKLAAFRDTETQASERRFQAAARATEEELARVLIQQRGAHNKQLLEKRNARMAQVFAVARARVLDAPATEYAAFMRALLEKSVGAGACGVRVHREDEGVFTALLVELNKQRSPGEALVLDTAHPLPERGGFVVVSDRYEVDRTLDTLITDIEREMAPQVAAELFGGSA